MKLALFLTLSVILGSVSGIVPQTVPPVLACGGASLRETSLGSIKVYTTPGWSVVDGDLTAFGGNSISGDLLRRVTLNKELTSRKLVVLVDAAGNLFAGQITKSGTVLVRVINVDGESVTFADLESVQFRGGSRGCSPVTPGPEIWNTPAN